MSNVDLKQAYNGLLDPVTKIVFIRFVPGQKPLFSATPRFGYRKFLASEETGTLTPNNRQARHGKPKFVSRELKALVTTAELNSRHEGD